MVRQKSSLALRLGKGRGPARKHIDTALLQDLIDGRFETLKTWGEDAGVSERAAQRLRERNRAKEMIQQQKKEERWTRRIVAAVKKTIKRLVAQPVKAKTRAGYKHQVVGYRQCATHMRKCWKGELKLTPIPPSWLPNEEQWKIIINFKEVGYGSEESRTRKFKYERPPGWFQRAGSVGDSRTPRWQRNQT